MLRALFLLLLLAAFATGAWFAGAPTGDLTRAQGSRDADGQRGTRPAHLRSAWHAFERDQYDELDQALEALRRNPPAQPRFAAEAELIPLLRAGDRAALRTFADEHQDVPAGAAALEHLIVTSEDKAERDVLVELLRGRYPRTWRGEARTK